MQNVMDLVREDVRESVKKAVYSLRARGEINLDEINEVPLEIPKDSSFGDFATTLALQLSKSVKQNPRALAEKIVNEIMSSHESKYIESASVAGPGFINFKLSNRWLVQTIEMARQFKGNYGTTDFGKGQKVLVEFVSANPTGPLNVVNARAAAVGDTLVRILKATGYKAASEFYVNDAGNQVDIMGNSVLARYRQITRPDYHFPENGYLGDYVKDIAKKAYKEDRDVIDKLSEDEQRMFFKEYALSTIKNWQRQSLSDYGVSFDRWFSERELRASGAVEKLIDDMKADGHVFEAEDAVWFRSTTFGDDKDRVLIKNDGTYTYVAPDLAYHKNKLDRGFEKLIDILGPDHHGYQGRMQAGISSFGYPEGTLEVILLQFVTLMQDGQPVKMSKRAGEFITMEELLEDVPRDAARYFFIMRNTSSHLDFDINLAKATTMDNPVWYIQYAHARACSILRQAEASQINQAEWKNPDLSLLTNDAETRLIKKMATYSDELIQASIQRSPSHMARYAYDLAGEFHSFYNECRVVGLDLRELTMARLALIQAAKIVLSNVLNVIGVAAPERM